MEGRIEQKIKTEQNIFNMLSDLPYYVQEYYYSISYGSQAKTCEDYIKKIRRFLKFINEDTDKIDISKVTDTDIGRYMQSLKMKSCNGKMTEYSFSYQKGVWTVLNGFFTYLSKKEYIKKNPLEFIKRPNNVDVVSKVSLNQEEIKKVIKIIRSESQEYSKRTLSEPWRTRDLCIFVLFVTTGMRREALREINVEDIDFKNHTVRIIDKRHHEYYRNISDNAYKILIQWMYERKKILSGIQCDALFISNRRSRITDKAIYNIVEKYTKNALGYSVSPHKLRASFGTLYYENNGHDIEMTRQAMGHASISMTQRYIVTKNNASMDASKIMDGMLGF